MLTQNNNPLIIITIQESVFYLVVFIMTAFDTLRTCACFSNQLIIKLKKSRGIIDSFKSLTSYQDLDIGYILLLLDQDNNPVFELEQNGKILQETLFSGNHLPANDFDENSKRRLKLGCQILEPSSSSNRSLKILNLMMRFHLERPWPHCST